MIEGKKGKKRKTGKEGKEGKEGNKYRNYARKRNIRKVIPMKLLPVPHREIGGLWLRLVQLKA